MPNPIHWPNDPGCWGDGVLKAIVAGSRELPDSLATVALAHFQSIVDGFGYGELEAVISGGAPGPDRWAMTWAKNHLQVGLEMHYPDYTKHGKRAPLVRNKEMAASGDVLIAFWDGQSRGTRHMINAALDQGLDTYVFRL